MNFKCLTVCPSPGPVDLGLKRLERLLRLCVEAGMSLEPLQSVIVAADVLMNMPRGQAVC